MNEQENIRLKKKINLLIDKLEKQETKNASLQKECEALQKVNLELKNKLETTHKKITELEISAGAGAPASTMGEEIIEFYTLFFGIVKKIHQKGEFIPYKNTTKYSESFCKVERGVFESYIKEHIEDSQDFLEKCCKFLCIKSEHGKCVYNNDKIRVYFLNKQLVSAILDENGAAAPEAAAI